MTYSSDTVISVTFFVNVMKLTVTEWTNFSIFYEDLKKSPLIGGPP